MNQTASPALHPWAKDLEASRDVVSRQKDGFMMVLGCLETFRGRLQLTPGREACERL